MSEQPQVPFGVMLVNLGTPENPDAASVRKYLAQFLSDPRVIRVPRLLWWLILHGIILRVRPAKVARLYQTIWTDEGSPLMAISRRQQAALQTRLTALHGSEIPVELAMSYGEPSITTAGRALANRGARRILVLPLYPQYSSSTTAAVFDGLANALQRCPDLPEILFIRDYWQRDDYLQALADSVQTFWDEHGRPDRLLMSFHGIPQRYEDSGDPYPSLCRQTAAGVAAKLGLDEQQWSESFQSRFGREEWVKPYTDELLQTWGQDDAINRVDVLCPAFAADCLETLEEIEEQNKVVFLEAGGKQYHYIPCLNDQPAHIEVFANLVLERAKAWL
ncbi:ferrochelatase [Ketobacter sp.]|uniref:ferrochelatase n=1 Tax=Ketobacter sp. TaxID=2083498 RepID=UPI0026995C89|nr:ferrochelatase [Ketobacter sp.]